MNIAFDKMEGAGNDFILIDDRERRLPADIRPGLAAAWCRRHQGIGADGLIIIEPDDTYDFAWDFYNADGSSAEMCGNGARCAARFAHGIGAAGTAMVFRTLAGPIRAELIGDGVRVGLSDARLPDAAERLDTSAGAVDCWFLNTGVPHAVVRVADVETVDVMTLGRELRFHSRFAPAGTNVNFFSLGEDGRLALRTYERGVEAETLACGTGTTAVCLVAGTFLSLPSPVTARTRSGETLTVSFTLSGNHALGVALEGPARRVFAGTAPLS